MNKNVKANFRLSGYEMKLLWGKAKKAGMSPSEFIRTAIFGKEVIVIDGLREHLFASRYRHC